MDPTVQQWRFSEGTDVVGADGDKVGKVIAVSDQYFIVEKGFFFPTDYYIPMSAVANYDGDKVYLTVTKDEALNQGWDRRPLDTADTYATGATGEYTTGTGTMDTGMSGTATTGQESLRVPVHEEELTATKRPVERGAVNVSKDVMTEEQTLNVPVTEERVRVDRRTVDRDAAPDDTAFQEGTISVPVLGEEVDVQKRARVAEEVNIGKEAVQRTEQAKGTVRKEQVRVEDQTDADVTDASSGSTASDI
jgi:uncharacterized protein (TIGR02271 family)